MLEDGNESKAAYESIVNNHGTSSFLALMSMASMGLYYDADYMETLQLQISTCTYSNLRLSSKVSTLICSNINDSGLQEQSKTREKSKNFKLARWNCEFK